MSEHECPDCGSKCEQVQNELDDWSEWADRERARYAMKKAECQRLQAKLDRMRPLAEAMVEDVFLCDYRERHPMYEEALAYLAAKGAGDE